MGFQRYLTGVAIAALLAGTAVAQTAPGQAPAAAGALDPAVKPAPQSPPAAPEFQMSDGVRATFNDSICQQAEALMVNALPMGLGMK